MIIKIQICIILMFFLNVKLLSANNCTTNEISYPNSSAYWRVTFVFNCFDNTQVNPLFPYSFSSQSTKYNEIDLSPNVYTFIPIDQLCLFKSLVNLDLSSNLIKSITNSFRDLACLSNLNTINLANNQINSSIFSTDFDDGFASKLRSLNLTNNMIGYIQSKVFVKSDGSTRFPSLEYLGLAYNRLKDLDLLWPLTLPNLNLHIDLKFNNISVLTNDLNLAFNNIKKYPMINNRKLDATTNSLQGFDDQNLLQYGLYNQDDLKYFLNNISNYDFRQANLIPTFICFCPSNGQLTLSWFRLITNDVDRSKPIFQLYCSNSPSIYVLEFPCGTATSFDGLLTRTFSTFLSFSNQNNSNTPDFANLLMSTTTLSSDNGNLNANQSNSEYFYLFFLIVPIFLILTFIFLCCIGRFIQVRTYHICACCQCFRQDDKRNLSYDAIICYDEFDKKWVNNFLSLNSDNLANFKISLFNVSDKNNFKKNFEKLKSSLRVIVIVSHEFFVEHFSEKNKHVFLEKLRVFKEKNNTTIIFINKDVDKNRFNKAVKFLETPSRQTKNPISYISRKLTSVFKYNCGLKQIEKLNFSDSNFWRNFKYVMPFRKSKFINEDRNLKKIKSRNDHLSYASDFKDNKNLKHVIIPIPDFMRTSLGFSKSKLSDSPKIKETRRDFIKSSKNLSRQNSNVKTNQSNNKNSIIAGNNLKDEQASSADILAMFTPSTNIIFPVKNVNIRSDDDDEINE